MEIRGYQYIAHKIVPRPWGIECRFTVDKNGQHINDIVMLRDGREGEEEIAELISERLSLIDRPAEIPIPERMFMESEIKAILIRKGYLTEGESLEDLKTKEELMMGIEIGK